MDVQEESGSDPMVTIQNIGGVTTITETEKEVEPITLRDDPVFKTF